MIKSNRVYFSGSYLVAVALGVYYVLAGQLQNLGILNTPLSLPNIWGLTNTPAEIPSLITLSLYYLPDPFNANIVFVNFIRIAEVILFIVLFFITQYFFVRLSSQFSENPVPNKNKFGLIAITSFQTMILTIGIIATLLDIPFDRTAMYSIYYSDGLTVFSIFVDVTIVVAIWFVWTYIYYKLFCKENSSSIISRLPSKLILISLLLVVATVLAQAFIILKGQKIYFIQGSYTGLVFGTTVLLWSIGVKLKKMKQRQ